MSIISRCTAFRDHTIATAICSLVTALGLCAVAPAARAQIPFAGEDSFQAPAEARWKAITAGDVRAAYRLLRDNHPGAAPELHDTDFTARLASAYTLALTRANKVESYQGYLAVLSGFAVSMGDKHIWSRPSFVVNTPLWPGFIVAKRGGTWVVVDTEEARSALKGRAS